MEKEQITTSLPDSQKATPEWTDDDISSEVSDFIKLLQSLNEKQREGLRLMILAAEMLAGVKRREEFVIDERDALEFSVRMMWMAENKETELCYMFKGAALVAGKSW